MMVIYMHYKALHTVLGFRHTHTHYVHILCKYYKVGYTLDPHYNTVFGVHSVISVITG